MKLIQCLILGSICSLIYASVAFALDVKDYTREAFSAAQAQNKTVVLWFHASWCPTCARQAKSFTNLQSDKALDGVTVFKADYDSTEELQREVKVSRQSSMIVYKGAKEIDRQTATTKEGDIAELIKQAL